MNEKGHRAGGRVKSASATRKAAPFRRQGREPIDKERLYQLYEAATANGVQGDAGALSELVAFARKKEARQELLDSNKHASLRSLLASQSPKVRKNTARLLGELGQSRDSGALIAALEKEQTLFVIPSILLALGNCRGENGQEVLQRTQGQWKEKELSSDEEKHREAVLSAVGKALMQWEDREAVKCVTVPPLNWYLIAPGGGLALLTQEAAEKKIIARAMPAGLSICQTDRKQVFALRCFEEALIPIASAPLPPKKGDEVSITAWASDVRQRVEPFVHWLTNSYEPMPIPYRIELRGVPHEQRGKLVTAVARALDEDGRVKNRPSSYVVELRMEILASRIQLFGKLFLPADERFAYRQESLPASIAPATAACLMRFAQPHMKENARVIDPCCGSGTLLVERALRCPLSEGLGVDSANRAVSVARKNIRAAAFNGKIDVVAGDLRRFQVRQPFDELVANLPFGVRVGDGDDADALYESLFSRLDEFLQPDGFALLYTTRKQLVERLSRRSAWKVRNQMRFEASGLSPWALLLQRGN